MDPFSIAFATANLFQGITAYNQGKSDARLIASVGRQEAMNEANYVNAVAGAQKTGYAKAGLELSGTPQAVIQDTYNIGLQDVDAIKENYRRKVKGTILQARGQLLNSIFSSASSIYKNF